MFTVDTNVLVYAANVDSPSHQHARAFVEEQRQGTQIWYCGWNTLYEFARVVTHPKVLRRPWNFSNAWKFCRLLLDSPAVRSMTESPHHAEIVAELTERTSSVSGNLVHDLHTVAMMKEQGLVTIYTCDSAFSQFANIRAIDPFKRT